MSGSWQFAKRLEGPRPSLWLPNGLKNTTGYPQSVLDLNYITWMVKQWRRFRWLLWGATALLWPLCLSGIAFLDADATAVRLALLGLLLGATGLCLYYTFESRRQLKKLLRLEKTAVARRAAQRPGKSGLSKNNPGKNGAASNASPPAQAPAARSEASELL